MASEIVNDAIDKNLNNPLIGHHFRKVDLNKLAHRSLA